MIQQAEPENSIYTVGILDLAIYGSLFHPLITTDVIITDERMNIHIRERHPGDYQRYSTLLPTMLSQPDYILADKTPSAVIVLKHFIIEHSSIYLRLSLKILTPQDYQKHPEHKNSILTFFHIHEREYQRLIRNKKILYKRE